MSSRAQMFDDLDRMDVQAWAAHLAPDAVMRLANGDPVYGRDACRNVVASFYEQIVGLSHHMLEQWEHGGATIVEGTVTYTRLDGDEVTVPLVTIYRTNPRDLIADYRVYIDVAPVYAPA